MRKRFWIRGMAVLGAAVLASSGWHLLILETGSETLFHHVAILVLVGGSGVALLYQAHWHRTAGLPDERYPRVMTWMVGGVGLFVILAVVALYLGSRTVTHGELLGATHVVGSVGLGAGVLVGTMEARALEAAVEAARAEAEAEALAAEQERLDRLNELLRHYTLNGVNIISGYAGELEDVVPSEEQPKLDIIQNQTQTIATLIEHVRTLSDIGRQPPTGSTVDLEAVLDSVVGQLPAPECVTVSLPDDAEIRADRLLDEAIYLLCDAVHGVSPEDSEVTVEAERNGRRLHLRVVAADAELPDAIADALFSPVGHEIGLKLYLAHEIVDQYGSLDLADGGEGVRFDLDLPLAETA